MNEANPDPHTNPHLLALHQSDKEYKFVFDNFHKSQQSQSSDVNICKVSKVVNEDLHEEYMLCRKKMSKDLGNLDLNEMSLFHGTSSDVLRQIIIEGFDWRLCGRHGTSYGRGSYFARDSSYSVRYCHTDSNGMKHMFLASVLTGKATVGNSLMVREPIGYNSTVDKEQSPSIFVIYHIKQAYPKYLITFKESRPFMGRDLSQMHLGVFGGSGGAGQNPGWGRVVKLAGGWQSDNDKQSRRKMIARIMQLLNNRKPNARPEWKQKVPSMARRLEDSLYRSAASYAEYSDLSTLKNRLQHLAIRLGIRAQEAKQKCVGYPHGFISGAPTTGKGYPHEFISGAPTTGKGYPHEFISLASSSGASGMNMMNVPNMGGVSVKAGVNHLGGGQAGMGAGMSASTQCKDAAAVMDTPSAVPAQAAEAVGQLASEMVVEELHNQSSGKPHDSDSDVELLESSVRPEFEDMEKNGQPCIYVLDDSDSEESALPLSSSVLEDGGSVKSTSKENCNGQLLKVHVWPDTNHVHAKLSTESPKEIQPGDFASILGTENHNHAQVCMPNTSYHPQISMTSNAELKLKPNMYPNLPEEIRPSDTFHLFDIKKPMHTPNNRTSDTPAHIYQSLPAFSTLMDDKQVDFSKQSFSEDTDQKEVPSNIMPIQAGQNQYSMMSASGPQDNRQQAETNHFSNLPQSFSTGS